MHPQEKAEIANTGDSMFIFLNLEKVIHWGTWG